MMGPWGGSIVISALCWRFSTARITFVSNRSPRIFRILLIPVSTSLRMAGVITYFLAVYSTFIKQPPESLSPGEKRSEVRGRIAEVKTSRSQLWGSPLQSDLSPLQLFPNSSLMSARNLHVFPIFRDRSPRDLDALRLQNASDLFIGQRPACIFFFDQLLYAAFQNQQRSAAALGSLHALRKEIAQFEHALRRVDILISNRAADSGRMHADLFGHFFDHHRLQLIDSPFEKILLARHDRIADLGDRLLPLLDVFNELDGGLVAIFHVITRVAVIAVAGQQALVC